MSSAISSFAAPKSKKSRYEIVSASQTTVSAVSTGANTSNFEFAVPSIIPRRLQSKRPKPPQVLRSAFQAPTHPKWTREPSMIKCSFTQIKATYDFNDGLNVRFTTSGVEEQLEVARNWENSSDEGYIGEGYSKRGIYVRHILSLLQCTALKQIYFWRPDLRVKNMFWPSWRIHIWQRARSRGFCRLNIPCCALAMHWSKSLMTWPWIAVLGPLKYPVCTTFIGVPCYWILMRLLCRILFQFWELDIWRACFKLELIRWRIRPLLASFSFHRHSASPLQYTWWKNPQIHRQRWHGWCKWPYYQSRPRIYTLHGVIYPQEHHPMWSSRYVTSRYSFFIYPLT